MSKRSREAFKLGRELWTYWNLNPGRVEVAWTDGWFGGRYRQGYEIRWIDGPTVERMRTAAKHRVPVGPALGELVGGDAVRYQRSLSLVAWAVKLLQHVHDGGKVPDLDHDAMAETWRDALGRTEFPERARTAEQQALAGRLVRQAMRDYRDTALAADRARAEGRRPPRWVPPEVLLGCAIAARGLHGTVIERNDDLGELGGAVVDLDRHRSARGLARDELGRE
jgi:hypothetical protein